MTLLIVLLGLLVFVWGLLELSAPGFTGLSKIWVKTPSF